MTTGEHAVAIVTGGSSGIGLAIVGGLQAHGYEVFTFDIEPPPLEAGVHFIRCDVSSAVDIARAIGEVGTLTDRVQTLVNCAGTIEPLTPTDAIDPDAVEYVLRTNLQGPMLLSARVVPFMRTAGGGSIINISSITGLVGAPGYPAYAASKSGLINLTYSLARSLARYNIRVNAICPGSVSNTRFVERQLGRPLQMAERLSLVKKIPLGRTVQPGDIANWVAFLASSDSGPITGSLIRIDGGEMWGN